MTMKGLAYVRAFGASFALVMLGFLIAHANVVIQLPSASGPSLGDPTTNLYSIVQALQADRFTNYYPALSVSQTSGQANCTQLNPGMNQIATSASTGYVCLPTAFPGTEAYIGNATGFTINIYGSAATFTPGTQDTINTVIGTTAYAGLTTLKNVNCFSPAGGAWFCTAGS
jgi:hypothetical protein